MESSIRISPKAVGAGLVALIVATLALTGLARGAVTTYPAGGSTFDGDAQGWTGSDASCSLLSGINVLCSSDTAFEPANGNPGGAIAAEVDVTLNLLGVFQGSALWTSPSFTIPSGNQVTGATLHLDRAFDAGGLISLVPSSRVRATLVDETAGATTELLDETLTGADSAYGTESVDVPAGVVVAGHSYRLRLATATTNAAELGVLGQSSTLYDNVGLAVTTQDASGGGPDGGGSGQPSGPGPTGSNPGGTGGGGSGRPGGPGPEGSNPSGEPSVSTGVRVVRGPLSAAGIAAIMNRLRLNAGAGHGPGGSLVSLSRCTIIGTPKADHVVGTAGNDVICGLGGKDTIKGGGGRDVIDGANGADRLSGQAGGDFLLGLRGRDLLAGGGGADGLAAGRGRDRVRAGAGADRIGARDRPRGSDRRRLGSRSCDRRSSSPWEGRASCPSTRSGGEG